MATAVAGQKRAIKQPGRTPITTGPWTGVLNVLDPYDQEPDKLTDAINLYLPDAAGGCAAYSRPGGDQPNASPMGTKAQGQECFIALDTTIYRFKVSSGKLYRSSADETTQTDVTPTNITIDNGATTRVYLYAYANTLIVSDGVYPAWVGTNLGGSPITATPINYLTSGTPATLIATNTSGYLGIKWPSFSYQIGATQYAATAGTQDLTAGFSIVTNNGWMAAWVTISTSQVVTISPGTEEVSEALALANIGSAPVGQFSMGKMTVQATGSATGRDAFLGGTDTLPGGSNAGPPWEAQNTIFYLGSPYNPWVAFGRPTEYQGSLFFISKTLQGVASRVTLLWCEPNTPLIGYEQSGYNDFWNLIQMGSDPIYAIQGTNIGLYYFRDSAIGLASGTPSVNFSTTATQDAISARVGTQAPDSVRTFLTNMFWVDNQGRPWMLSFGNEPVDIYKQMRAVSDAATGAAYPAVTSYTATAAIVPDRNLYAVAIWSPAPATPTSPTDIHVFDAVTGTYQGRWQIMGSNAGAISVNSLGVTRDTNGQQRLCVLGSATAGGSGGGYVWMLNPLEAGVWLDNGNVPTIMAQTQRFGYSAGTVWGMDQLTAVCMSQAACSIHVTTPYKNNVQIVASVTPSASNDKTYRLVAGLDERAIRDAQFQVSPLTASSQWGLTRVVVMGVASMAGPVDE